MEIFYKAYSKTNQNKIFYFVKKYISFPEYKDVADILEGYGMHTDFHKACNIAGLTNQQIRKQLFEEIQSSLPQAKVIDLNPPVEVVFTRKTGN